MPIFHPVHLWKSTTAALTLGVLGLIPSAHAAVQFSDGFAYSPGALNADGPPAGAPTGQTAWSTTSGSTQVTTSSLIYAGIASTGNKASVTGVAGNNGDISTVNLSLAGTAGNTTEWIAFLINEVNGGATPGGYGVLSLSLNGGIGPAFGMLFNQNVYGIDNDTADVERSSTGIAVGSTTHLFVAKLDFTAGTSYLFVDPSLATTPGNGSANASLAMTSAFKASGFNELVLAAGFNTATFNMDQIKVGTTFADVVPEPSAESLLVIAAVGVGAWFGLRRVGMHGRSQRS